MKALTVHGSGSFSASLRALCAGPVSCAQFDIVLLRHCACHTWRCVKMSRYQREMVQSPVFNGLMMRVSSMREVPLFAVRGALR